MALKAGYHGIKNIKSSQIMTRSEQEILGAKNFLKPRTGSEISEISNGVTFTFYPDGSVKANGTSTGDAYGTIYQRDSRPLYLAKGDYIFSCPFDNTGSAIEILVVCKRNGVNVEYGKCRGKNQITMNVQEGDAIGIVIHVFNGKTVNNVMFYPMIRLASDPDNTYVPYAMTNQELTDSLFAKDRIITSSDDLDNITESGIYSITTAPVNSPEGRSYAALIVKYRNENDITQLLFTTSVMYTRRKSGSPAVWTTWYKYSGTQVTPSNLTSASPETRSDDPELTEDEPIVKKTTKKATKKATKKTEEV